MQIHHILSGGASDGNEMTIGDYMAGKLNEPGAWDKANAYFNTLLASGWAACCCVLARHRWPADGSLTADSAPQGDFFACRSRSFDKSRRDLSLHCFFRNALILH